MLNLQRIDKPETMQEALRLLQQAGEVVLAGGTQLVASRRRGARSAVDLSALGLDYIEPDEGSVKIGAMTLLRSVSDSKLLRPSAAGVVARAAHRTAASVLRNQATIAGTLIAEPAGVLAVTLLALDASLVVVSSTGETEVGLATYWNDPANFHRSIVREIRLSVAALNRRAVLEAVARTPRDKAIVSVCLAANAGGGSVEQISISLGGVAPTAVRARRAEQLLAGGPLTADRIAYVADAAATGLNPESDYRGSAEYRTEMVRVLVGRLLGTL
ncbi:MAG: FAD binding domain-containing protein [Rudaea sp.]